MKTVFSFLFAFVAAGLASPANAGSTDSVLEVRALVVDSCSVSATPMSFELGNAAGSIATAQSSIALECNGSVPYELALDSGAHAQGSIRRMEDAGSGKTLSYEIYSDAAHSTRWGNRMGFDTVSGTADIDGKAIHTAYGAIPAASTTLTPGTYSDTVVVSVNF